MFNKRFVITALLVAIGAQNLAFAVAFSTEGFGAVLDKAERQKGNIEIIRDSAPANIVKASEQELLDQCNSIGQWGRALSRISSDNKKRTLAICGELIKDKHPRAYAAISAKAEEKPEASSVTKDMQKALAQLEVAGAAYDAKQDTTTNENLFKACKAVSEQRRTTASYGRNQIIKLSPEQKNMICKWCDNNSLSKDAYEDTINYEKSTGADDAREPYCAAIRTVREDKEKQEKLDAAAAALRRGFGFGK